MRNISNTEGHWIIPRPACPGASACLTMDMRKLLPQECETALRQGTREVEIPVLGSFQGSVGQKHSWLHLLLAIDLL